MLKSRSNFKLIKRLTAVLMAGTLSLSASAQSDVTARQRVLDYLERQNPAPINSESLQGINSEALSEAAAETVIAPDVMAAPDPVTTVEPVITADPIVEPDLLAAETNFAEGLTAGVPTSAVTADTPSAAPADAFESEIIATSPNFGLSAIEREDSIVRDLSTTGALSNRAGPESFGFFTTARDYLAQRGQAPQPRLTLRYDVSRKNAKTAALGKSSVVDIIIGTDYAAISKSSDEVVIYDFKEKRLLNLSKTENRFTNASLFAAAYRSLDAVGKMTNGGKNRSLPLKDGLTLDAFYLESALGYSAVANPAGLTVLQSAEKVTADLGGQRVFSAMLDGPALEDYRQAYSFIGLLYHSEPVHPAILAELVELRSAPNSMTFHSFGPKIPDGEIISWTLKSKMAETASFPLPASAKSVIEIENVSPLGFVMSEAVAGRALGGRVDPRAALTVINQQLTRGDALSAWVSGQSLKDSLGGCEQLSGLCQAISSAESKKSSSSELTALIEGLSLTRTKASRTQGLTMLKSIISAPDAPSLVLRRAGLALAKTSPAERASAGLSDFDPAVLLTQAIARNPYDLLAYQGLAQLRAARGDFIQSWDINDALRALPDVPQRLRAPIDRAERQLVSQAPGFFPPVDG